MQHLIILIALLLGGSWVEAGSGADGDSNSQAITGKLLHVRGRGPILKSGDREYRLASSDEAILEALEDARLANRELRLEGQFKGNDVFEVAKLYTVRDGKLHRVVYFCQVCNITAYRPGDCYCCQKPFELREIPVAPFSAQRN